MAIQFGVAEFTAEEAMNDPRFVLSAIIISVGIDDEALTIANHKFDMLRLIGPLIQDGARGFRSRRHHISEIELIMFSGSAATIDAHVVVGASTSQDRGTM